MGTITLPQNTIDTDLNNRVDLFVDFAGGVIDDCVYDPQTSEFEVPGVTDQALQDTLDNWATLYADWQTTTAPNIGEMREAGNAVIDAHAGATRMKFITVAPGQEMTYLEKADEAADFVAAGYPADLSSYPFIQAEVNATGQTATEAADAIIAQKGAWITIGSEIEEHRMTGKTQMASAANQTDVDAIVSSIKALLDSVGT